MLWPWRTGSKAHFHARISLSWRQLLKLFFLEQADGRFTLKEKHAYYYQVQAQIKFCSVNYCDFVVRQENELVVQRIYPDEELMSTSLKQATLFFKFGVLPELLGKWNYLENGTPRHQYL